MLLNILCANCLLSLTHGYVWYDVARRFFSPTKFHVSSYDISDLCIFLPQITKIKFRLSWDRIAINRDAQGIRVLDLSGNNL